VIEATQPAGDPPDVLAGEAIEPVEHEPSEITYDEQFFPARPERVHRRRPSARRALRNFAKSAFSGQPDGQNDGYVKWLVEQSMLWDAKQLAIQPPAEATARGGARAASVARSGA
jgi:hypothetical protein